MRERCTHLLKVYATRATKSAHTAHTTHTTHATHAAHAAHAAHTTVWVVIQGRRLRAFLLILINPLGKVGLDVRVLNFVFHEAGPILVLEILFTKVQDEGSRCQMLYGFLQGASDYAERDTIAKVLRV
jgi:hypothetical protein